MQKDESIIAVLSNINPIGYVILPYLYQRQNENFITTVERLSAFNIGDYHDSGNHIREFFRLSEEFSYQSLLKQFSKKKQSAKEFLEKADKELLEVRIRPYIEKRLVKIISLLAENQIDLYDGRALPNLYPSDLIHTEPEKAETRLKFTRTDEGTQYQLKAFHKNQLLKLNFPGNQVITQEPCWYLSGKRLFNFKEGINGKLLIPFSKKECIDIPKRLENQYFNTFIRKIIIRSEIEAEGFQLKDLELQARALLSLEQNWQGSAVLILSYDYGEKVILANDPQKVFTRLISDESGFIFNRFKRNLKWEQSKIQLLKSLGLQQLEATFRLKKLPRSQDSDYLFINWLSINRRKLESEGFTILQNSEVKYALEVPELSMEVRSGNDWFDLYALVILGSFRIPFIRFKNHIINHIKEFELPSGERVLLPEEWFDRYQQIFMHSTEENQNIRLKKHHFILLESFDLPAAGELKESLRIPGPVCLPKLQNIELRPYQQTGFFWLLSLCRQGFGGILADDMGLGKTMQAIALLTSWYPPREIGVVLRDNTNPGNRAEIQPDLFSNALPLTESSPVATGSASAERFPCSLIIMPTSLIHNWVNEFTRISPGLRIYIYTGGNRRLSRSIFNSYDVVLTTYGTLRNDADLLGTFVFGCVILDESQNIKNPFSQVARAAFSLRSGHRIAITGTPIENSLSDLWSQMNFVNPELLGNHSHFSNYYLNPLLKNPRDPVGDKLRALIDPFILRRTKEAVTPELPPLTETISYCSMGDEQQQLYESEKSKIRNELIGKIENNGLSKSSVMVLRALMQLRQLANHPRMLDAGSAAGSGKFEKVTEMLEVLLSEKHKVLIFSSFIKHLSLLEDYCHEQGHRYALLKGSTTDREKVINRFRKNDDTKLFLISLKAGGVGLNLTEADYVFVLDPWWNPAAEMQAINRAHRIGQDKKVFVYRFISNGTVEEKILRLQKRKKELADQFIRPASAIAGLSRDEIMDLFE